LWLLLYIMIGMNMRDRKLISALMIFLVVMMPVGFADTDPVGSGFGLQEGPGEVDEDGKLTEEDIDYAREVNARTIDAVEKEAANTRGRATTLGAMDPGVTAGLEAIDATIAEMNNRNVKDPIGNANSIGAMAAGVQSNLDQLGNAVDNFEGLQGGTGGSSKDIVETINTVTNGAGVLGYDENVHGVTMDAFNELNEHLSPGAALNGLKKGGLSGAQRMDEMLDKLKEEWLGAKDYRKGNIVTELEGKLNNAPVDFDWDGFFDEGGTLSALEGRVKEVARQNTGLTVAGVILGLLSPWQVGLGLYAATTLSEIVEGESISEALIPNALEEFSDWIPEEDFLELN
jgi:hypothetical protein